MSALPSFLSKRPLAIIVGGASFLGSRLCESLLVHYEVICIDTLRFGKRQNIQACLESSYFTFIQYDKSRGIGDLIKRKASLIIDLTTIDRKEEKGRHHDVKGLTNGIRTLLDKAIKDHAKFLLISPLSYEGQKGNYVHTAMVGESLVKEYITNYHLTASIIRIAPLFGPHMSLDVLSPLNSIVGKFLKKETLAIANSPETILFPVYIEDAILLIHKVLESRGGTIYNLLPNTSLTFAQVIYVLTKLDPSANLFFSKEGITLPTFTLHQQLPPSTEKELQLFKDQLLKTLASFSTAHHSHNVTTSSHTKSQSNRTYKQFSIIFLSSLLFFGTILPLFIFVLSLFLGISSLQVAYDNVKKGNIENVTSAARQSHYFLKISSLTLPFLYPEFFIIGKGDSFNSFASLVQTTTDASDTTLQVANAGESFAHIFAASVKQDNTQKVKPLIDKAIGDLNSATQKVSFLQNEMEDLTHSSLPEFIKQDIVAKKSQLKQYSQTLTLTQTFANVLPDVLGVGEKRTYVILLQNNMELRPTGGFIGSYGIISLDDGKLISLDISDVYKADGQMKGHVEPPEAIKKYLNQPNWFLRDSNWDPDFQISAKSAAFFLDKEMGLQVQGVIGVDVSFVQLLLAALGPVTVSDYKETIAAQNLFEKAETYSDRNSFPGSTQKSDFLGAVTQSIINRLLHDDHLPWLGLLSSFEQGVEQKHMLFSFNNESIQKVFTINNWAGSIFHFVSSSNRYEDYRMVVEANVGLNKTNYYIKRSISDDVTIADNGSITGKLKVIYNNTSQSAWPGGPYTTYTRALLPQGAKLLGLTIDGNDASASAQTKQGSQFQIDEELVANKASFGFLVTVSPQTSKTVEIHYQLPSSFPLNGGRNTYAYVFQKQPGTQDDALSVTVRYPKFLTVKSTNVQAFKESQLVSLSSNLLQDRLFEVELLR